MTATAEALSYTITRCVVCGKYTACRKEVRGYTCAPCEKVRQERSGAVDDLLFGMGLF